jgi:hypothetical protein
MKDHIQQVYGGKLKNIIDFYKWILVCLIFSSLLVVCKNSSALNMKNLVTLWLFDEGSGQVVADETGNGHQGTIQNPKWVAGKFGTSLEFQGQAGDPNYVIIRHHANFDFGQDDFTIGLWINSKKADAYIIAKRKLEPDNWWNLNSAIDRPGNFFGFEYAGGGAGAAAEFGAIDGKVEIVNSGWHHVAAVKAGDNLQLYVDGILDAQKDGMKKNPKWSVDNKDPIQIGGWGKVENLVGSVDEIFIAKEAFTADDFKKIMNGWKKAQSVFPLEKLSSIWGKIKKRK